MSHDISREHLFVLLSYDVTTVHFGTYKLFIGFTFIKFVCDESNVARPTLVVIPDAQRKESKQTDSCHAVVCENIFSHWFLLKPPTSHLKNSENSAH